MSKTAVAQEAKAANILPSSQGILQRKCACGNQTVAGGKCAECGNKKYDLQRKLTIGASNDPLEREADRVADQVMAAPIHSAVNQTPLQIQRYAGQASEGADNTAPASVNKVLASSGRPMEPALRQDMEQRFGYDFSQVRVHSGAAAEQSAREVNARAYTVGNNVVFGAGPFASGASAGRRLLAHELTHVVQQSGTERVHASQSNEQYGSFPIIQRQIIDGSTLDLDPDFDPTPESAQIISRTVVRQPTPRTRTDIGVGEKVRLFHTAGRTIWTTTAGRLTSLLSSVKTKRRQRVTLTAPDTAQSLTITAGTASKAFNVIAPTGVHMEKIEDVHTHGQADIGMTTKRFLLPDIVNFGNVLYHEKDKDPISSNPSQCKPSSGHCGAGGNGASCSDIELSKTVKSGKGTMAFNFDCVYMNSCGSTSPYIPVKLTTPIPCSYKVGTGPFYKFTTVTQLSELESDASTLTASKAGADVESTVLSPTVTAQKCTLKARSQGGTRTPTLTMEGPIKQDFGSP